MRRRPSPASCASLSRLCHRAELERRRDEGLDEKLAIRSSEHAAAVRRQKKLLAELGVPDVSPNGHDG